MVFISTPIKNCLFNIFFSRSFGKQDTCFLGGNCPLIFRPGPVIAREANSFFFRVINKLGPDIFIRSEYRKSWSFCRTENFAPYSSVPSCFLLFLTLNSNHDHVSCIRYQVSLLALRVTSYTLQVILTLRQLLSCLPFSVLPLPNNECPCPYTALAVLNF